MIKNKMKRKRLIILVFLVLASSVFALNSDFNNDNKIDLDDFFLFADQYGKNTDANNMKFDLDKNGKIDVEDFFIFADHFGKPIGDFDNNGCVDQRDLDLANRELNGAYDAKEENWNPTGSYPDDFGIGPRSDAIGLRPNYYTKIRPVVLKYDLNGDFYVFSLPPRGNNVTLAKKDLEIFNKVLGAGCKREEVLTKPGVDCSAYEKEEQRNECWIILAGSNLDKSFCSNIKDSADAVNGEKLKKVCNDKVDFFNRALKPAAVTAPTPATQAPVCGNNKVESGEECDGSADTKAEGALYDGDKLCSDKCIFEANPVMPDWLTYDSSLEVLSPGGIKGAGSGGIYYTSLQSKVFIQKIGVNGGGISNDFVSGMSDFAVDKNGYIYIINPKNYIIVKLDPSGRKMQETHLVLKHPQNVYRPFRGIYYDPFKDQIIVLHTLGMTFLYTNLAVIGEYSPLSSPIDVAITKQNLVVLDEGGFVSIFDNLNFRLIKSWGTKGVSYPRGVASDGAVVYVTSGPRVTIFDMNGNYLGFIGSPIGKPGSKHGEFSNLYGILYDNGYLYVADGGNQRIEKFKSGTPPVQPLQPNPPQVAPSGETPLTNSEDLNAPIPTANAISGYVVKDLSQITGMVFSSDCVVSGIVKDAKTGGGLPGASVQLYDGVTKKFVKGLDADYSDGSYCFRKVDVSAGRYSIVASMIGYVGRTDNLVLNAGDKKKLDFSLKIVPIELKGVEEVSGVSQRVIVGGRVTDERGLPITQGYVMMGFIKIYGVDMSEITKKAAGGMAVDDLTLRDAYLFDDGTFMLGNIPAGTKENPTRIYIVATAIGYESPKEGMGIAYFDVMENTNNIVPDIKLRKISRPVSRGEIASYLTIENRDKNLVLDYNQDKYKSYNVQSGKVELQDYFASAQEPIDVYSGARLTYYNKDYKKIATIPYNYGIFGERVSTGITDYYEFNDHGIIIHVYNRPQEIAEQPSVATREGVKGDSSKLYFNGQIIPADVNSWQCKDNKALPGKSSLPENDLNNFLRKGGICVAQQMKKSGCSEDKKSVLVYTCDDNCGSAKKIECGEGKVCGLDENGIGACVMGGEEEELECDPKEPTLLRRSTKPISKLLKIGDEREFCGNEEINVKEDWKDSVEGSYYQKRIITKNVNGVDVLYKQIRRKGEETILGTDLILEPRLDIPEKKLDKYGKSYKKMINQIINNEKFTSHEEILSLKLIYFDYLINVVHKDNIEAFIDDSSIKEKIEKIKKDSREKFDSLNIPDVYKLQLEFARTLKEQENEINKLFYGVPSPATFNAKPREGNYNDFTINLADASHFSRWARSITPEVLLEKISPLSNIPAGWIPRTSLGRIMGSYTQAGLGSITRVLFNSAPTEEDKRIFNEFKPGVNVDSLSNDQKVQILSEYNAGLTSSMMAIDIGDPEAYNKGVYGEESKIDSGGEEQGSLDYDFEQLQSFLEPEIDTSNIKTNDVSCATYDGGFLEKTGSFVRDLIGKATGDFSKCKITLGYSDAYVEKYGGVDINEKLSDIHNLINTRFRPLNVKNIKVYLATDEEIREIVGIAAALYIPRKNMIIYNDNFKSDFGEEDSPESKLYHEFIHAYFHQISDEYNSVRSIQERNEGYSDSVNRIVEAIKNMKEPYYKDIFKRPYIAKIYTSYSPDPYTDDDVLRGLIELWSIYSIGKYVPEWTHILERELLRPGIQEVNDFYETLDFCSQYLIFDSDVGVLSWPMEKGFIILGPRYGAYTAHQCKNIDEFLAVQMQYIKFRPDIVYRAINGEFGHQELYQKNLDLALKHKWITQEDYENVLDAKLRKSVGK